MQKNLWRDLFDRSNENGKKTSKKELFFENFISTKATYKKYREQEAINTNSPNKIHKNYGGFCSIKPMKMERTNGFLKILQTPKGCTKITESKKRLMQNHLTKFTKIYEGFYSMKALKIEKNSKKGKDFQKNYKH